MEAGVVKIAEDSDFDMLKKLVDDHLNWKLDYDKGEEVKACTFCTCLFIVCLWHAVKV